MLRFTRATARRCGRHWVRSCTNSTGTGSPRSLNYLGRDLHHWLDICRPDTEPGPDRGFRPSTVPGSGLDGDRPILQAVLDACGTPARSLRILDLAAGASGLAVEFGVQGATVVAVDRAPEVVGRLARACRDIAPDRMTCIEADVLALDLEALERV